MPAPVIIVFNDGEICGCQSRTEFGFEMTRDYGCVEIVV
jgi:hypothetical protein